jgi:hydroxyacylglutathione hydrolase
MVRIDVIQVGVLATNCYLIHSENSSECVVVDAGGAPSQIIEFLEQSGLTPASLISTHAHADHTGAVASLSEKRYSCDFMLGAGDVLAATQQHEVLTTMLGDFQQPPPPSRQLNDGDSIAGDGFEIKVLATPGHTEGSISLYVDGHVMTGDTLFHESIGRFDLPGGDEQIELASIRNILYKLDDSTVVLPGHVSRQQSVTRSRQIRS